MRSPEYREQKKKEIMEKCFECYCENGLRDTGIKELGKYCGIEVGAAAAAVVT